MVKRTALFVICLGTAVVPSQCGVLDSLVDKAKGALNSSGIVQKVSDQTQRVRDQLTQLGEVSSWLLQASEATVQTVTQAKKAGCDVGNLKQFDAAALQKLVASCPALANSTALPATALPATAAAANTTDAGKEGQKGGGEKKDEKGRGAEKKEENSHGRKGDEKKEEKANGGRGRPQQKFSELGSVEPRHTTPWPLLVAAGGLPLVLLAMVGGLRRSSRHESPLLDDNDLLANAPLE